MNRYAQQFRTTFEAKPHDLYFQIAFGASGAPSLVSTTPTGNQGLVSITRSSAGKYVLTLDSTYVRVLSADYVAIVSSGIPAAPDMAIVSSSVSSISAPTLTIQFSAAGVATDPASGEQALIHLTLKNSSIM